MRVNWVKFDVQGYLRPKDPTQIVLPIPLRAYIALAILPDYGDISAYLAQLYEYERLPDFIDPTAPAEPVLINNETGMLSAPTHPEVFFNLQVLPEEIALERLINVHKQRLIAAVIKSFVGGQDLATNMPFEVDQKWDRDYFRMRSLTPEALHSIASKFSTRPRRNIV
ncbi:hypothetical protein M422DRAFT_272021 [Sphaerobolus stellatus SS14]|uniref:Uncharacterized protein n=1 Tax=Sphaerobolus stellatus (strain SS14) TaxID=990650 RepID=A0A0C9UN32_SPHS4|nr:hypothetical protein M422DRAFT_272021 [Sphaerobolus stellatus SS14]